MLPKININFQSTDGGGYFNMEDILKRYAHAMTIDPETGKPMPKVAAELSGSFVRLKGEEFPTPENDNVQDGNDLLVIDEATGGIEAFIFYKGEWREI